MTRRERRKAKIPVESPYAEVGSRAWRRRKARTEGVKKVGSVWVPTGSKKSV